MTPKRKTKQRANAREYRKRLAMTPEQRAAERAYHRDYERKRRANMTPQELDAYLAYKREYQRERQAAMTSKQLEAQKKYQRDTVASGGRIGLPSKSMLRGHASASTTAGDGEGRIQERTTYSTPAGRMPEASFFGTSVCGGRQ
jgi:hypothetical protein